MDSWSILTAGDVNEHRRRAALRRGGHLQCYQRSSLRRNHSVRLGRTEDTNEEDLHEPKHQDGGGQSSEGWLVLVAEGVSLLVCNLFGRKGSGRKCVGGGRCLLVSEANVD